MTQNILFHTIGVVGKVTNRSAADSVVRLVRYLKKLGTNPVIEQVTSTVLSQPETTCLLEDMADHVELIIVVGGDGSLLSVARAVAAKGTPVLGINRGSLGFLTDIQPNELEHRVLAVLSGEYQEESRFLLEASVVRENEQQQTSLALNDVVVHAGTMSRMMLFHLAIDDVPVYSQRSDGVIISTPTGSTAYALSAGGPIMHPMLDAIVVVPMFPHTLTSRPIVLRGNSRITITLGESNALKPQVSCDSQVDFMLHPGDKVIVQKSHVLKLLRLQDHSFYEACRSKLDWASRVGTDVQDGKL